MNAEPYVERSDSELAREMQQSIRVEVSEEHGREVLVLEWTCPACSHHCRRTGALNTNFYALLRRKIGGSPRRTVDVVRCDCGQPHEGRPDDGTGCGFWALVTLTARGG